MMTVPEAAERTGRSPETIRRWIRAGKLAASKVGTQHVIDERDLAPWLKKRPRRVAERPPAYRPEPSEAPEVSLALRRRVVVDSEVLAGKPVVRGTRISVELVLGLLAAGWSEHEILENYPGVTRDDLLACLAYAADRLRGERLYPLPAF